MRSQLVSCQRLQNRGRHDSPSQMAAELTPGLPREEGPTPAAAAATGALVQSFYAVRDMRIYPVAEHELESLTTMNMLNTALLAVGIGLISLAIGIAANYAFAEKITPEGDVLTKFGAPILAVLGIVAFLFCGFTLKKRNAIWDTIRSESKSTSRADGR